MSKFAPTNNDHQLPTIAITPGEPAGIGPDITLALASRDYPAKLVCIADPALLQHRAAQLGAAVRINVVGPAADLSAHAPGSLNVLPITCPSPVEPGVLNHTNSHYVLACLAAAVDGLRSRWLDGMVTGPVHKGVINEAGIPFTGHTEYLAKLAGNYSPVMMLVADTLRVALATTHIPLRAVSDAITLDGLIYVIETVATGLRDKFRLSSPRIAVCGLNPHAGEGGHLGLEDDRMIAPAIAHMRARGFNVIGPLPADTAFTPRFRNEMDAYIAMYHDQGLPVLKALGFGNAVNLTLGLPFVRTSVDHGTALSLAATGRADGNSLHAAMMLAIDLAHSNLGKD